MQPPSSILVRSVASGTGLIALGAAGAAAVIVLLLPRARRWLAWGPLVLAAGGGVIAGIAALVPGAGDSAAPFVRFCGIASLLQSLVLLVAVAAWERFGRPMPKIFLDVVRWLGLAAAVLATLWESGIDAGELITGSALITAVLGFALKDTLGNVFAGLAIHAEHPFEIGDWIQYDTNPAHVGRVVEINWRATKVITLDEAHVIIPNGQLAQASIRNFTKPEPWSRRSLYVVTPYEVPPQRVHAIILEAIRGSFGVLEQPAPSVVTNDFKDRGVEHWVRLFTTEFDKRDRVDGMARDRIWYALARHGIEIPVATHAVRLTTLPPAEPEPDDGVARRAAALSRTSLFAGLGDDLTRRLAADAVERLYASDEPVVREGDPGASMFVILAGRVEVTARDGAASAVRVADLGAGQSFGEMSLMTGAPRSATVTAREETRVIELGKEPLRQVFEARPELIDQLGRLLQERAAERSRAVAGAPTADPEEPDIFRMIRDFFSLSARPV